MDLYNLYLKTFSIFLDSIFGALSFHFFSKYFSNDFKNISSSRWLSCEKKALIKLYLCIVDGFFLQAQSISYSLPSPPKL